jgi:thioester reductase-like protein
MSYFVTGATGFVGRHLVSALLKRKGPVHVLVRKDSRKKLDAIGAKMGWDMKRIVPVEGDMTGAKCGVGAAQVRALNGKVKHFFHLAAVYDLTAKADVQRAANVDGTQHALDLAAAIGAGTFHHTSSIAAAGLYPGVWREDMFDEAEGLDDPYLRTKHDSEGLVRNEKRIKWRIYRPGMVVGHSQTGEMDKIDGPYYFFSFIKKLRECCRSGCRCSGLEGGRINIVPVDFVADAMDHIAHKPKLDGHTFHLTDPEPMRVGEVLNAFARAGHAPEMTMRIDARMFAFVPAACARRWATCRRCGASSACCCATSASEGSAEVHHLSHALRQSRSRARAQGQRHRGAELGCLRVAPVGLLGTPPGSGPVRRPLAQGQGAQQGRGDHRRVVGHRPVHAQRVAEAGAVTSHRGARRGRAVQGARRDEGEGGKVFAYTADLADMADCDRLSPPC